MNFTALQYMQANVKAEQANIVSAAAQLIKSEIKNLEVAANYVYTKVVIRFHLLRCLWNTFQIQVPNSAPNSWDLFLYTQGIEVDLKVASIYYLTVQVQFKSTVFVVQLIH